MRIAPPWRPFEVIEQMNLMYHVTVPSKVLTGEMERQQSHGMTTITWFCEVSPSTIWFQYTGIPHPALRGDGSRGDTRGGPYPGERTHTPVFLFRLSPYTGPWGGVHPWRWDRRGGGAFCPHPCLSGFNMTVESAKRNTPPKISRMYD